MSDSKSMITVDFWNTLVRGESGGEIRRRVRVEALRDLAENYRDRLADREIEEAFSQTSSEFHRIWFDQQRTPTTDELVRHLVNRLGFNATENELSQLAESFEESLWEGPPELLEGVEELLPELSARYPLALISDTMYSPGRVLRKYLEMREIDHYFEGFVFSDETGYSKPHPDAFTSVLEQVGADPAASWHVGDLLKTDIKGAKQVGMGAILFTGASDREEREDSLNVEPDHVCDTWKEIGELLLS